MPVITWYVATYSTAVTGYVALVPSHDKTSVWQNSCLHIRAT